MVTDRALLVRGLGFLVDNALKYAGSCRIVATEQQIDVQDEGPGISEALVATAVGLVVAIPSLICFNWLKGLLKRRLANADFLSRLVVTQLKRRNSPAIQDANELSTDNDDDEVPSDLMTQPAGAE